MKYQFIQANESMLNDIFNLYVKRIDWMNKVGLKQWNVTNYFDYYPQSYFENCLEKTIK